MGFAGHDLDRRQAADPVCRGMGQEDVVRDVDHQILLDQRGGAWCCPQHIAVAVGQVTIKGTGRLKAFGIEFGPQFRGHGVGQVLVDQVHHGNHAVAAEGRLDCLGVGGSIEITQRHRLSVILACGELNTVKHTNPDPWRTSDQSALQLTLDQSYPDVGSDELRRRRGSGCCFVTLRKPIGR